MAKVQIKSDNLTPFGGFFYILTNLTDILGSVGTSRTCVYVIMSGCIRNGVAHSFVL